jgi:mono/diheme cytochrome c family protein
MRTNFAGFFLAAGMGLIVLLLGLGALSMAGLVSIVPDVKDALVADEASEMPQCGNDYVDNTYYQAVDFVPATAEEKAGDALFKANCAQCHAVNEKVVGPALAGITKRRSISWLIPWVRNSAKVVASGDDYAVKLYNDNGKQQMPSFGLSEKEIKAIIAYIEASSGYKVVVDYGPVATR